MKKIDIKSVLAGLCIGVLGMLAVGAAGDLPNTANQNGRYQITGSGALFMVLDSSTGQVWCGDFHNSLDGRVPPDWRDTPSARAAFFNPKVPPTGDVR